MTEFEEMVEEDLSFTLDDATNKLLKIASLRGKYMSLLMKHQRRLNDLELDRKKEFGLKWEYYSMDADQLIDRRDIPTYIEKDDAYQLILSRQYRTQERIDLIEGTIKAIDQMSFNLNSAIKWEIFKAGG